MFLLRFITVLSLLPLIQASGGGWTSARQNTEYCECRNELKCNAFDCLCRRALVNNNCECVLGSSVLKVYSYCYAGDRCCRVSGVRRTLQSTDAEYRDMVERCGDYDYEGVLYVDSHVHGIARPTQDAIDAGCPWVTTQSQFAPEGGAGEKEMMVWEDPDEGESLFGEDSLKVGTFKLAELSRAYEAASPNAEGATTYDIVSNNCGSFLISLARELDVDIDYTITSYVVRRLVQSSSQELMDRIRSAFHSGRFLRRGDGAETTLSDEELVELLVEEQTSEL